MTIALADNTEAGAFYYLLDRIISLYYSVFCIRAGRFLHTPNLTTGLKTFLVPPGWGMSPLLNLFKPYLKPVRLYNTARISQTKEG